METDQTIPEETTTIPIVEIVETTTAVAEPQIGTPLQEQLLKSFEIIPDENGVDISIRATNNESMWTDTGYHTEPDLNCAPADTECGNNLIITLGGHVIGVVGNVENEAGGVSHFDAQVSSSDLREFAQELGLETDMPIPGAVSIEYEVGTSMVSTDVEIETVTNVPETTTTLTPPIEGTIPAAEEVPTTTSTPGVETTTTTMHVPNTLPVEYEELAYTGGGLNTLLVGGSLVIAGLGMARFGGRFTRRNATN